MNRDEKNVITRQKIIDGALFEFSENNYGEASLNAICAAENISKGSIYHYFKDKDELYLSCVKECFDALTCYLDKAVTVESMPLEAGLVCYFDARIAFFVEHPFYLGVFCSARLNPPAHLFADIDQIAVALNKQSVCILTSLLKTVNLRVGVTINEVVAVFCEYQDFVNARFQMKTAGESTIKEHTERCRRSLQILLYGVIEREA